MLLSRVVRSSGSALGCTVTAGAPSVGMQLETCNRNGKVPMQFHASPSPSSPPATTSPSSSSCALRSTIRAGNVGLLFMAQPRRQTALANASAVQHGNAAVLRRTMASATAAPPQPSTGNAEGDAGFVEKEKAKLLKGHIVQSYLNLVRDQEIQLDPKQLELATELQVRNLP